MLRMWDANTKNHAIRFEKNVAKLSRIQDAKKEAMPKFFNKNEKKICIQLRVR